MNRTTKMTKTNRFGQRIADIWHELVEHLNALSEKQIDNPSGVPARAEAPAGK
ncbi:hypothetical protein [Tsuneonella troitsensis]|uniref:hypothetical protein n=1 Tax=Tsuneonella troitsensis TaxID=292222 RepID=UPI0013DE29F9|nr:hypothetical protein [Tsuneonella troitsensis]